MSKVAAVYMCSECGNETLGWQGKCSFCDAWNTIKQVPSSKFQVPKSHKGDSGLELPQLVDLSQSSNIVDKNDRIKTIDELDRVLGGGLVDGGVLLLTGEPGIGKSTLLLQIANWIGNRVAIRYISGEESVGQVGARARRLGINHQNITLASLANVNSIMAIAGQSPQPRVMVIDSIQTCYDPGLPSSPGSIVQVRESALKLTEWAKQTGTILIISSHVTKEGTLAGPRTLEHLVDTVLYLEGDRFQNLRMLRGIKNRFGPTDEVGVFEMTSLGLAVVDNPSELFLAERQKNAPGSVITAVTEGMRPFLAEVQALATPVKFGYPKRRAIGIDLERLDLVLAVLEKRAKIRTSNYDIFCSLAGGIKSKEPAIDLAVAVAVCSAIKNHAVTSDVVFYGELGLTGEIRKVRLADRRAKEANRFGLKVGDFKTINQATSF